MSKELTHALALLMAYGTGGIEASREILAESNVDAEQVALALTALAHALATSAAAGYRESTEEVLRVTGQSMAKLETGERE
jgi:hypothetical protein